MKYIVTTKDSNSVYTVDKDKFNREDGWIVIIADNKKLHIPRERIIKIEETQN